MKYITSTLTIVALFTITSANAKQMGKKATTAPTQPQPQPQPIRQPQPMPQPQPIRQPQPQPIIIPEPTSGPTYENIYDSLRKKRPDASDSLTLRNIIYEAEQQIKQIQASVGKKTTPPAPQTKIDTPTTKTHAEVTEIKRQTGSPEQKITEDIRQQIGNSVYRNKRVLITELITNQDEEHTKTENMLQHYFKEYPNIDAGDIFTAVYNAIIDEDNIKSVLQEDPSKTEEKKNKIWNILYDIYRKSSPMTL